MEHRVYASLTKPIILMGVPVGVFGAELLSMATFFMLLNLPPLTLLFFPLLHGAAVYATMKDNNWHKAIMIKGKYFSKNRPLIKGRVRYNA